MARFRPRPHLRRRRFRLADSAQQVVGRFLLAGPFVVTEEVWTLAVNTNVYQSLSTVAIVFGIGYAALYKVADSDDDRDVAGLPVRFVSLVLVSYGAVAILALTLGVPETFLDGRPARRSSW